MSVVFSNCTECQSFKWEETDKAKCHYWCEAFPNGIPAAFMFRKDQDETAECNNGIKFVAIDSN